MKNFIIYQVSLISWTIIDAIRRLLSVDLTMFDLIRNGAMCGCRIILLDNDIRYLTLALLARRNDRGV